MRTGFKLLAGHITVQFLIICLTVSAPIGYQGSHEPPTADIIQRSYAASTSEPLPANWESYSKRPDILSLRARSHDLGQEWETIKAAHFSFVAELLALYPADTHFYFLARDSEYLYDVARMMTEGTDEAERIHLLNVSSDNMSDPNLAEYLKENGISTEILQGGRKILFVDTGFAGTIPQTIADIFPERLRGKLKTHLIASSNDNHPSSRAFLVHLNPAVNEDIPAEMIDVVFDYERMPRYTNRSPKFFFSEGRYHPISRIRKRTGSSVSKTKSLKIMEDLKAESQKPGTVTRFHADREQMTEIIRLVSAPIKKTRNQLRDEIQKRKNTPDGRLLEAQVRDVLEAADNAGLKVRARLRDLGLKIIRKQGSRSIFESKKFELSLNNPGWEEILYNAEEMIPKLFEQKKWKLLDKLIEAQVDYKFNLLIAKSLYDGPARGMKKDLQLNMIEIGEEWTNSYLTEFEFSEPHTEGMEYAIKALIETDSFPVWRLLAKHVFSKPHTARMIEALKLLVVKGHSVALNHLEEYTFPMPHTQTPEHQVLRAALQIEDPARRKTWIDAEFTKLKSATAQRAKSIKAKKNISSPAQTEPPRQCMDLF